MAILPPVSAASGTSSRLLDRLLDCARGLRAAEGLAEIEQVRSTLAILADGLDGFGNARLSAEQEWDEISQGVAALIAAATLRPAVKALSTLANEPEFRHEARQVLTDLATTHVVRAMSPVEPVASLVVSASGAGAPSAVQGDAPAPSGSATQENLGVLDNIARTHREHERFYSAYLLEQGTRLVREATKLKVVADHWLEGQPGPPDYPGVDFQHPAFRAAGCDDLNAPSAIASIGILFMEGQGEPSELRILKAMLGGSSAAAVQSGKWLSDMMQAAWDRERTLFTWERADAARFRFRTIATNWVGAQETALVGRMLAVVNACLAKIDFTPSALRVNRQASGKALLTAARILAAAGRLQGQSGVDLVGNDDPWTAYRRALQARIAAQG
jgi:hypothetical protein